MGSALSLAAWVTAVIAFVAIGIGLLPNGADYPFPPEFATAISTLYQWLYSFNMLLPVDTLAQILLYSVTLEIFIRFVWPIVLWVMKTITGGGQ